MILTSGGEKSKKKTSKMKDMIGKISSMSSTSWTIYFLIIIFYDMLIIYQSKFNNLLP